MNKEAVVSLRLDPDTVAQLRNIANQEGVTVSDLLRKGALAVLEEPDTMRVTWTAGPNVTLLNDQTVRVNASAGRVAAVDTVVSRCGNVVTLSLISGGIMTNADLDLKSATEIRDMLTGVLDRTDTPPGTVARSQTGGAL